MQEVGYSSAAKAEKQTFVDPLDDAARQLVDVTMRLRAVADRLCGGQPPASEAGSRLPTAVPNGIFEQVSQRGHDMLNDLETARDALVRLERALP